jgi:hypothetical protein
MSRQKSNVKMTQDEVNRAARLANGLADVLQENAPTTDAAVNLGLAMAREVAEASTLEALSELAGKQIAQVEADGGSEEFVAALQCFANLMAYGRGRTGRANDDATVSYGVVMAGFYMQVAIAAKKGDPKAQRVMRESANLANDQAGSM